MEATAKVRPRVLTKPDVPRPTMLLVSSVGSIIEEILLFRPATVLIMVERPMGVWPLMELRLRAIVETVRVKRELS